MSSTSSSSSSSSADAPSKIEMLEAERTFVKKLISLKDNDAREKHCNDNYDPYGGVYLGDTRNDLKKTLQTLSKEITACINASVSTAVDWDSMSAAEILSALKEAGLVPETLPDPSELASTKHGVGKIVYHREEAKKRLFEVTEDRFWRKDENSKDSHPLLVALSAPGTGKSLFVQNAAGFLKQSVSPDSKLGELMTDIVSVNVTFHDYNLQTDIDIETMLTMRVLTSYFGIEFGRLQGMFPKTGLSFAKCLNVILLDHRERNPDKKSGTTLFFLAVDDINKVADKDKNALMSLTTILGASLSKPPVGCFFVALLTGTVRGPVIDVLTESSYPYVQLPLPPLSLEDMMKITVDCEIEMNTINGKHALQRLLLDSGGIPRVISWIVEELRKSSGDIEVDRISMASSKVNTTYGNNYNWIGMDINVFERLVIMAVLRLPIDSKVHPVLSGGKLTFDELEKNGRLVTYLNDSNSFVIVMPTIVLRLYCSSKNKTRPLAIYLSNVISQLCDSETTWQKWESFNAHHHALLNYCWSRYRDDGSVGLDEFYAGATVHPGLHGNKLLLSAEQEYRVQENCQNCFPHSWKNYEELSLKTLAFLRNGGTLLNTKDAKADVMSGSPIDDIPNSVNLRLLHMKFTALNVQKHAELKQSEVDRAIADSDRDLKNIPAPFKVKVVHVVLSNRNFHRSFRIPRNTVVVGKDHLIGFYGHVFGRHVHWALRDTLKGSKSFGTLATTAVCSNVRTGGLGSTRPMRRLTQLPPSVQGYACLLRAIRPVLNLAK